MHCLGLYLIILYFWGKNLIGFIIELNDDVVRILMVQSFMYTIILMQPLSKPILFILHSKRVGHFFCLRFYTHLPHFVHFHIQLTFCIHYELTSPRTCSDLFLFVFFKSMNHFNHNLFNSETALFVITATEDLVI